MRLSVCMYMYIRRIYIVTPCIVASKSYGQLFLVPAVAPHLFGSLNHHSMLRAILHWACVCEFAVSSAKRSRPPFSAHVLIKIPQYTGTKPPATVHGGIAAAAVHRGGSLQASCYVRSRSSIRVCSDHSSEL